MIIARISGGLGNQMFQYAAARRLAHHRRTELKLDLSNYGPAGDFRKGLEAFSRVLAEELRPHGVRVGVLVPGAVDTPIWDAMGSTPPRDKMLRPEDVARAAVLMATLPPHAALEELTLLPAGGIL